MYSDKFIATVRAIKAHPNLVTLAVFGVLIALGVVLGLLPPQQGKAGFMRDEVTGMETNWGGSQSVLIYWIDDSFTVEKYDAVHVGFIEWNDALGKDVFLRSGNRTDADVLVTEGRQEEFSTPDSYGKTTLEHLANSQVISRASIKLSPKFGSLKKPSKTRVVKHEIGHALGLEHTQEPTCILFNLSPFGPSRGPCPAELELAKISLGIE